MKIYLRTRWTLVQDSGNIRRTLDKPCSRGDCVVHYWSNHDANRLCERNFPKSALLRSANQAHPFNLKVLSIFICLNGLNFLNFHSSTLYFRFQFELFDSNRNAYTWVRRKWSTFGRDRSGQRHLGSIGQKAAVRNGDRTVRIEQWRSNSEDRSEYQQRLAANGVTLAGPLEGPRQDAGPPMRSNRADSR